MRSPALAAVLLAAAIAPAQGPNWHGYLRQNYPNLEKVTVQRLLMDARASGVLSTTADQLALKRAFRQLRGKRVGNPQVLSDRPGAPTSLAARPSVDMVAIETEYNDGFEFADDAIGQAVATGNNAAADDPSDMWRIVSTGEFFDLQVVGSGGSPIADSFLRVFSGAGLPLAANDDGYVADSDLRLFLPAGLYLVEVGRYDTTDGGDYDLLLAPVAAPMGLPITNGSSTATGVATGTLHVITIPDAHVAVDLVGLAGADLGLTIQAQDGTLVFENDDSSRGLDPSADLVLPAGNYFLTAFDITGAPASYDLAYTVTPQAIPELCAAGTVTANVVGDESMVLYRLDLTSGNQRVTMTTTPGASTPLSDTILDVYDSNLHLVALNDDDAATYYSGITLDLPAAGYWVGIRQYWGSGGGTFVLTATCGQPFVTAPLEYGTTAGTFQGIGDSYTYELDVGTDVSMGLYIDSWDAMSVVDGTGQLVSGAMDLNGNTETTALLRAGRNYVLAWQMYQWGTPYNLSLTPPLNCTGGALQSRGKAGDLTFLFASLSRVPGVSVAPNTAGLLCLPFGSIVTLNLQVLPVSGRLDWITPCPVLGFSVFLQQGDVHGNGWSAPPQVLGTWRNVLELH